MCYEMYSMLLSTMISVPLIYSSYSTYLMLAFNYGCSLALTAHVVANHYIANHSNLRPNISVSKLLAGWS